VTESLHADFTDTKWIPLGDILRACNQLSVLT